ncbi:replication-relaxation family protein [Streptomyces geranii]|uniref:replication-relaxation family protein n=1 Tax=Streptomyces geranii TaxID=2058923 RepID=UPI000D0350AA|nr:replication-relaxation family protein [Streptomyces geranii]
MNLSTRDMEVVRLVGRFYQLTSSHIASMVFPDTTGTPVDRTMARLVRLEALRRIGRRAAGPQGGAGSYAYQLGPRGWWLLQREGKYRPYRAVNLHALEVADAYVELLTAERAGAIQILHTELEQSIGSARPDMTVEIGLVQQRMKMSYAIEVDRGSEKPRIIAEKCAAYIEAFYKGLRNPFPYVLFLVPDEWRKSELSRVLGRLGDCREIFSVKLAAGFGAGFQA